MTLSPSKRTEIQDDLEFLVDRYESMLEASARGKFGGVGDSLNPSMICEDILRLARAVLAVVADLVAGEPEKEEQDQ